MNKQNSDWKVTKNIRKDENQLLTKEEIDTRRITFASEIPDIEPIVSIGGSNFAVKGDISVVGGLPKAGKTAISVFMLGTALVPNIPSTIDTLKIKSTYAGKKPVIYIDTEQSPATTNKLRKSIVTLLDLPKEPDNLHIYNLRKIASPEKKMQFIETLFQLYPNTHLWIIDGLADLIGDPNNTTDSFQIISWFMAKSEEHHTAIIFFLHENPGHSSKLRGNLGSEIERKCYGAITIKKDREKQIHSLETRMLRGSNDFEPIYFRYDLSIHRMVSLEAKESEEYKKIADPKVKKLEQLRKLAEQCFVGGGEHILYTELKNRIINHSQRHLGKKIGESTAKSKITKMMNEGIISKDKDERYGLLNPQENAS